MTSIHTATMLAAVVQELETAGFQLLGDLRDLAQAAGAAMPIVARVFVDAEGAITAAVYDAPAGGPPAGLLNAFPAVDLETPLDDGTVLTTSNAPGADVLEASPHVRGEWLAAGTGVCALLERHRLRVAEWLRTRPAVSPLRTRSIDDVIHHRQRLEELRAGNAPDGQPGVAERQRA